MFSTICQDGLESILFFAFRYALGRKTYAVSTVANYLIEFKHVLATGTKQAIVRDIEEAIKEERAGMDMDVQVWQQVRRELNNDLP